MADAYEHQGGILSFSNDIEWSKCCSFENFFFFFLQIMPLVTLWTFGFRNIYILYIQNFFFPQCFKWTQIVPKNPRLSCSNWFTLSVLRTICSTSFQYLYMKKTEKCCMQSNSKYSTASNNMVSESVRNSICTYLCIPLVAGLYQEGTPKHNCLFFYVLLLEVSFFF